MNIKKMAQRLNGKDRGYYITKEEELAKKNNMVILTVTSDSENDYLQFRGAVYDEISCYHGIDHLHFDKEGIITKPDKKNYYSKDEFNEDWESYLERLKECVTCSVIWAPKKEDCTWLILAKGKNEAFNVMDGRWVFCKGVVIQM